MSIQVLTITLATDIVLRIDSADTNSEGALLDTKWHVSCFQVLRIQKLTRQRSRGTVRAGKFAILWGSFVAQS